MATKFVSFLGTGKYTVTKYRTWRQGDTAVARESKFVQCAIAALYPHEKLDQIVLLFTEESKTKHHQKLREGLRDLGVADEKMREIEISSDITQLNAAWEWFERLQDLFVPGDTLVLDVTHGFRIVPIVFSAAVAYLRRVKQVRVDAVLYGAYDDTYEAANYPIVDVKDFYTISDWTEGVARLVDTADSGFLRQVAESETAGSFVGLNDTTLLNAIEELTQSFRNVELQQIEDKTRKALKLVAQHSEKASVMEGNVLAMIEDKFGELIAYPSTNGAYSEAYLRLQVRLIQLLAEHGLYMQSFTAIVEWVGSLGCYLANIATGGPTDGREGRMTDDEARRYADVFKSMLEFPQRKWRFLGNKAKRKEEMLSAYDRLMQLPFPEGGKEPEWERLWCQFIGKVGAIRNGFNHGWTGQHRQGVPADVRTVHDEAMRLMSHILDSLAAGEGRGA